MTKARWRRKARLAQELEGAGGRGYDATELRNGHQLKLQIKGRCVSKDIRPGKRIGTIDVRKEFDAVLLVYFFAAFYCTKLLQCLKLSYPTWSSLRDESVCFVVLPLFLNRGRNHCLPSPKSCYET